MQKQCHIILYIPDYHVNIHRVCSTLRNIDWLYTTSICPPVHADQNFKLNSLSRWIGKAGLAIVYYHKSPFCMMRLLSTQI